MDTKMQTRDYISSGILSLIYMVVTFIVGAITQAMPATFLLMPMFVAIFTGPIFMLYAAKIPKRGAITILGLISGIISFVGGMFWMMAAFFVVFGVVADLICAIGTYRSFKWNLLAQNWWVAVLIIVGSMVCGVIGGIVGKSMMKKHFERAGIV